MITSILLASAALTGTVKIDGSSTVYPITEGVSEDFQKENQGVRVTAGSSGTGAGYKKFCAGEIDITGASRPIKPEEVKKCAGERVEFMELPVAFDGLTVVVNPKNTFVKQLTFAQLKKIWEPGSKVKTWKDIDASWPNDAIKLYGPNADHGTFDYFTEEIVGKAKSSRTDYTAAADTNSLVNGVSGDANALGYFGYAYFASAKAKLRAIPISKTDGGTAVMPENKVIEDGTYPLSRPIFITVNKKACDRPEVDAYVQYYLKNAANIANTVGYTPLPGMFYEKITTSYKGRKVGPWNFSGS